MAMMVLRETRKRWADFAVRKFQVMARRISKRTRRKWVRVAVKKFRFIFSYYRLSRMLLLHSQDFIGRKLISFGRVLQNKLAIQHYELEEWQSRWSNQFPQEIMELVLQRLRSSDYIRCRAVCLSWKEAVDIAIASKRCSPAPQLPWLLLCSHYFSLKNSSFLSIDDQKIYRSSPNYMNRLKCVGSIEGWLIMVDSALWRRGRFTTVTFFLNPISGARVMLPSQSTILRENSSSPSFFYKVSASSVPTSQDCLVASLCSKGRLAFCRPSDRTWAPVNRQVEGLYFCAIEIIDGRLYAVTSKVFHFLIVLDIHYSNGGRRRYTIQRLVMLHPRPGNLTYLDDVRDGVRYRSKCEWIYLSKDSASKELYIVLRSISYSRKEDPIIPWSHVLGDNFLNPPKTGGFRVFKLELNDGPRWVEVGDLFDKILFISKTGSDFIRAIDLNNSGHGNIIPRRNCIYFAFDNPCCLALPSSSRRDVGVFSLTSRSIEPHNFPKDESCTRLHAQPIWFTPSLW